MKVLVLKSGIAKEITGEEGKYWICGEERFRKLGNSFTEIREVPEPLHVEVNAKAPAEIGGSVTAAAKKKPSASKKKKAEAKKDGERGE